MKGPGLTATLLFGAAAVALIGGWWMNQRSETGTTAPPAASSGVKPAGSPAEPPSEVAPELDGAALYAQHCASCHMMDGYGVPNFQPAIAEGPVVAEGRDKVEAVIRAGSAALQDRTNPMGWEMPPLGTIGDPEIEAIVTYVMAKFGPDTP